MDEACRLRRDEGYGACEDEALLFAYFFWRSRKSRSPKAQLQCCCKNGTPVNPDKRADVGIGPYRVQHKIGCGATVAALPHQRHSGDKWKSLPLQRGRDCLYKEK